MTIASVFSVHTSPYMGSNFRTGLLIVILCLLLAAGIFTGCHVGFIDGDEFFKMPNPDIDSSVESIRINGARYIHGVSSPIEIITDEIFSFQVVLRNTGITTWGRNESTGEHGASLLSRGDPAAEVNGRRPDDYNETFGSFLIIFPMQMGYAQGTPSFVPGVPTLPGAAFTYNTILRAPGEAGTYTMRWQTAEYPIGQNRGYDHRSETRAGARSNAYNYFNRPFFGKEIVVNFVVNPRVEQAPLPEYRPGVLDKDDFVYEGSFTMPEVWPYSDRFLYGGLEDNKSPYSGITIRTVSGEKRMLALTGTSAVSATRLYEVAIPSLAEIRMSKGNISGATTAALRTNFGGQSNLNNTPLDGAVSWWEQGGMWYDQEKELLYWTNAPNQAFGVISTPAIYSAKLVSGEVLDVKTQQNISWGWGLGTYLDYTVTNNNAFLFGITNIPAGISAQFGSRNLALGFGGGTPAYSQGPALYAVRTTASGDIQSDRLLIMHRDKDNNGTPRDGNYLPLSYWNPLPASPWEGKFLREDKIRSGIFIDYGGKRAYMTFPRQHIGRAAYDFGGLNFFGRYQDSWYFYDVEDLGKAAGGIIPFNEVKPSSYSTVTYPTNRPYLDYESGPDDRIVTGACFDQETGLLYIYKRQGMNSGPVVHVYSLN